MTIKTDELEHTQPGSLNSANLSKMLLVFIFISLGFVLFSVLLLLRSEFTLADNTLEEKIKYTNQLIKDMVIEDLWLLDIDNMKKNINEFTLNDRDINTITVIDNENISHHSNQATTEFNNDITHEIKLSKNDFELGKLLISYSTIDNQARKKHVQQLMAKSIAMLLLIMGLVYLYKRNQREIYRANVTRYRSIFSHLMAPVIEFKIDDDGLATKQMNGGNIDVLSMNSAAKTYFKQLEDIQTATQPFPKFIYDEVGEFLQSNQKYLSTEKNFHSNGSEHTLLLNFHKYHNLDINSEIIILSVSDLTTLKAKAREEKLMLQQRYAQQNIEEISKLAGEIAHDFNNILFSIMGYVDLARLSEDKKAEQNYLSGIEKACESAKEIVNQILMSSRDKKMGVKVIDVIESCQEALNLITPSMPEKVKIHTHFNCTQAHIRLNQTNIVQILLNLCTNAAQAMPDGEGNITITVDKVLITDKQLSAGAQAINPGEYIVLKVSDDGTGIAPELLEKIKEPYFTTKAPGVGVGLGLSLVTGIISNADGYFSIDSKIQAGSTFTIYFPLTSSSEQTVATDKNKQLNQNAQIKSILFVDDNEAVTRVNVELLEKLGFSVTPFLNSIEALHALSESPSEFDLLISDIVMPDLSGVQLLERIQKLGITIPTILISGYNEEQGLDALTKHGVKKIISKPFYIHELYDAICSIQSDEKTQWH